MRFGFRLLLVLMLLAVTSAVTARTWTSETGQTTTGKFVRVHQDQVVILRGSRAISLPFAQLSDDDQEYVRAKLKAKGQEHLLPPAGFAQADDGDGPSADNGPSAERIWTDDRGRQCSAAFVRVEGGLVVVLKAGKEVSFPMARLSQADQRYVSQRRSSGGKQPSPFRPPNQTPRMPHVSHMPRMPRMPNIPSMPNRPRMPKLELAPRPVPRIKHPILDGTRRPLDGYDNEAMSARLAEQERRNQRQLEEQIRRQQQQQQLVARQRYEEQQREAEQFRQKGTPKFRQWAHPNEPGPADMECCGVKACSKCNKILPESCGAGDRCPHCGTYLSYEEDAEGNLHNAYGVRVPRWWMAIGGTGGLIVIVLVGLRLLVTLQRD